nr:hypothetical protein Q903MT_gene5057 [Picea sitchensis]
MTSQLVLIPPGLLLLCGYRGEQAMKLQDIKQSLKPLPAGKNIQLGPMPLNPQ